jgi:hypothetical protein
MKIKINNKDGTDSFIVEGTLEECQQQGRAGATKRGWKHPWSEKLTR